MPAVGQQQPKPKKSSPLERPLQRTGIGDGAVLAQHITRLDPFLQIVAAIFHLDNNAFSWKEGSLKFVQPFLQAKVDM